MSQQINLYNPIFLKLPKHFSARTMLQALTVIAAGIAAFGAYAAYQTAQLEGLAVALERQLAAERARLAQFGERHSPQGAAKRLEAELRDAEERLKAADALLASIRAGDFGSAQGFSEYFSVFARRALPGVWLTGVTIGAGGNELNIQGRVLQADLVPAYLRGLNAEAVMRGRSVVELKLVARDETELRQRGGQEAGARGPARYVEFSLSAPLAIPEAADPKAARGGRS
jgi:Tfp pilus assembly protein PilN